MVTDDCRAQTPEAAPPSRVNTRTVLKIVGLVLGVAATLWIMYRLGMVLLLLVISIFFSYLIAPLVMWFEKPVVIRGRVWKLPRAVAILLVYLAIALVIIVIFYSLIPALTAQISAFTSHLPEHAARAKGYLERLELFYKNSRIPVEWQKTISAELSRFGGVFAQRLERALFGVVTLVTFVPWLILVPILSFFMLKDAEALRNAVVSAFPTRRLRLRVEELFSDASRALAAYIRAQLLACIVVGTIASIGFKLLGSPYPLALGVMVGTLEFIPLAGPLVSAMVAIGVSATVSFKVAFYTLIFLLVLRIVEDYMIYPRLVGHGLEMPPLAIIVGVLCGAELGGVIGIFLAIPAIALITIVYKHWLEYKGSRGIMADLLQPPTESLAPITGEPTPPKEPAVLPSQAAPEQTK